MECIFLDRSPLALLDQDQIRAKAFSRFWLAICQFEPLLCYKLVTDGRTAAPPPSDEAPPQPLVDGTASMQLPSLFSKAVGTVLELGPGSGALVGHYKSGAIDTIYGAEPVTELHPALRKSFIAAGLGEKFHILSCSAEKGSLIPALARVKAIKGSSAEEVFDSIVCARVLCSVQDPRSTVETLYDLLKPGGRFVIYEHVINPWRTSAKGSILGRWLQIVYQSLGWSFFVGDCQLHRDTARLIQAIGDAKGGWGSVELEKSQEWATLPFVSGYFVKRTI